MAKVGTSTVTRVMRGDRNVTAQTREAVLAAVRETGYQVNSLARGLKQRRSFVIGHLLRSMIPNPFYVEVARGVEDAAKAKRYTALTYNVQGISEAERSGIGIFLNWQAEALIFTTATDAANVDFAVSRMLPVVQVERPKSHAAPAILVDNSCGALAAMRHLTDLGHRDIAYIGGIPMGETSAYVERERIGAYRDALAAVGASGRELFHAGPRYLVDAENSLRPGYTAMQELLSSGRVPTAIQCVNDIVAAGALQALREAGLRVPEEVSVLGFDDTLGAYLSPPLTTVQLPAYQLGETAATMAIEAIEAGQPVKAPAPLRTKLILRRSLAAPRN
jgi:LacI family transcriptional regulator